MTDPNYRGEEVEEIDNEGKDNAQCDELIMEELENRNIDSYVDEMVDRHCERQEADFENIF